MVVRTLQQPKTCCLLRIVYVVLNILSCRSRGILINLFLRFIDISLPFGQKSHKSLIYAFILPFLRSPKSITSAPRSPRIFPDARALNLN